MRQKSVLRHLIGALMVVFGASCMLQAQAPECPPGYQISETKLDANGQKHIVSCLDSKTGDLWFAAKIADSGGALANVRAFGAKGDGATNDTPAIVSAYNSLPSCSASGWTWNHCGELYLPPGIYKTTSELDITGPVRVVGAGTTATRIEAQVPSGCGIKFEPNPPNGSPGNLNWTGIYYIWLHGSKSGSNVSGLCTYGVIGFKSRGLSVTGFPANEWDDENGRTFNENFDVQMFLAGGTNQWLIKNSQTAGSGNTFGYGQFNIHMDVHEGQKGVATAGYAQHSVDFEHAQGILLLNVGGAGTCFQIGSYSTFVFDGYAHCEQSGGKGAYLSNVAAGSTFGVRGGVNDSSGLARSLPTSGTNYFGPYLRPTGVAQLPSCTAAIRGQLVMVNNSNTNTWGGSITGEGHYGVLALCNGENWTVAGR